MRSDQRRSAVGDPPGADLWRAAAGDPPGADLWRAAGGDPPGADLWRPAGGDPTGVDPLRAAVELARSCPVSSTAYAVGAVVVTADGAARATGWSRQRGPYDHAEEAALAALRAAGADPTGGTLYSSLEPCSTRRSRARTCTEQILAAGIARVEFALREPPLFADCRGAELLAAAGVEVVERPEYAAAVRAANAHLLG